MDINNYAENFIKEFDVKSLDIYVLKSIVIKLGYKVIEYNPLINGDYEETIVEGLDLEKELEKRCCFSYKTDYISAVFFS